MPNSFSLLIFYNTKPESHTSVLSHPWTVRAPLGGAGPYVNGTLSCWPVEGNQRRARSPTLPNLSQHASAWRAHYPVVSVPDHTVYDDHTAMWAATSTFNIQSTATCRSL